MRESDHDLRSKRMVFYSSDVEKLERELDSFLEVSGSRTALLVDLEGHMVTRRGECPAEDVESLAALVAGSFAATTQVARLMGEDGFRTMAHQGPAQGIQFSQVGDRALLVAVWDERSNLGLVKYYGQETAQRLEAVLEAASSGSPDEALASDYGEQASAALDDLF